MGKNYHLQKDQDALGKLSWSACAFCIHLPDLQSLEVGAQQMDHTEKRYVSLNTHLLNNQRECHKQKSEHYKTCKNV